MNEPENPRITLAEILDQDSLQRVCMSYARMYGTGLSLLDTRGQLLVDIPAQYPICRRISAHPAGAKLCRTFDNLFLPTEADAADDPVNKSCPCGLQYEMMPIRYQGVALGRLVFGPYRPPGMDGLSERLLGAIRSEDPELDARVLREGLAALQRMAHLERSRAVQAVRSLEDVLSVIVQTGYARHITSQIHVAAIQDAYNELTEKNRRLADSVERLKELDKLKSSFLATISHELRTPLTSVIGYSEMLLEGLAGDLNKEQREYAQIILDKGDQLLHIINEILNISRIETGNIHLACEQVDLPELLRQINDVMMPQARRKEIQMSCRVQESLPPIFVDRAKTRQVLLNLLSNAIKFTLRGGEVEVTADQIDMLDDENQTTKPAILIRVRDTGIGIPEACHEKIFEAFYQVDGSSTREYGGTGLGLSIVKNFVEAHGGRVWVESAPAGGSIFSVRLPINSAQGGVLRPSALSSQPAG